MAFVYGREALVEDRGLGWDDVRAANPSLVYARCRPSRTAAARSRTTPCSSRRGAGFCTQLAAHRPGPMLVDVRASASGAAFLLTASALALLRRRALIGTGGWADTSLYDGMLATLGCMIGRSERAAPKIESYWAEGSFFPNFLYRCGDGELLQIWFGGKGMYDKVIEVLGDEPSTDGYYAEQMSGLLQARAERWHDDLPARAARRVDRAAAGGRRRVRAGAGARRGARRPPPGRDRPGRAAGPPTATDDGVARQPRRTSCSARPSTSRSDRRRRWRADAGAGARSRLLEGVRVVDFSAFVAGPLAAEVLADLGADVVKVEPPAGEAMRAAAYAIAACQRGKRSIAIDITDPAARPVVERAAALGRRRAAQLPRRRGRAARDRRRLGGGA